MILQKHCVWQRASWQGWFWPPWGGELRDRRGRGRPGIGGSRWTGTPHPKPLWRVSAGGQNPNPPCTQHDPLGARLV